MEEADAIVLLTLRQMGLDFNVNSVKDFDASMIVTAVARGLAAMSPAHKYSEQLPREMSARYRLCSDLATGCQELGYMGDLGYHQFLYPSEADSRKLLMWIVENMPKQDHEHGGETTAAGVESEAGRLERAIANEIRAWEQTVWTPYECSVGRRLDVQRTTHTLQTVSISLPDSSTDDVARARYQRRLMPLITEQPQPIKMHSSLLEFNAIGVAMAKARDRLQDSLDLADQLNNAEYAAKRRKEILKKAGLAIKTAPKTTAAQSDDMDDSEKVKCSRFEHSVAFADNGDEGELKYAGMSREERKQAEEAAAKTAAEQLKLHRQAELQELNDIIASLLEQIAAIEEETLRKQEELEKIAEAWKTESEVTPELEEKYKIKKRVYDLLPDGEKNIKDLQLIAQASKARILELEAEWEKHRGPLLARHDEIKAQRQAEMAQWKDKLDEIKQMRYKMKNMLEEAREKEQRHQEMTELYAKLPKDVERATYTHRITELTKSMKKQHVEIEKILVDTRSVQKEINHLADVLSRTFAVTDELVYQEAVKDPTLKQLYRYLADLHENFQKVTKTVEETGQAVNAVRDLESQIEALKSRISTMNVDQVTQDINQIRKENRGLAESLGLPAI